MNSNKTAVVTLGEGVATIKRDGSSTTTVAAILGRIVRDGVEVICLDRLVHEPHEGEFTGWQVAGAVTTLLSRPVAEAVPCDAATD